MSSPSSRMAKVCIFFLMLNVTEMLIFLKIKFHFMSYLGHLALKTSALLYQAGISSSQVTNEFLSCAS